MRVPCAAKMLTNTAASWNSYNHCVASNRAVLRAGTFGLLRFPEPSARYIADIQIVAGADMR
jgi:hypothetical protein